MLLTILETSGSTIEVSISTWKITLAWDHSKYENLNFGYEITYNVYDYNMMYIQAGLVVSALV